MPVGCGSCQALTPRQFVNGSQIPSYFAITSGQSVTAKVQGYIDSSWADLVSFTVDDTVAPALVSISGSIPTTGTWTQIRASITVNSGAGLAEVDFTPLILLIFGLNRGTITAS